MQNLKQLRETIAAKEAQITELTERITQLEKLIQYYEEQFRLAKHRQFGSSSEKGQMAEQLSLFTETETTAVLQVLSEPGKPPTTNSYMWLYRTSGDTQEHVILYEYQPGRSRRYPQQFLSQYQGLLHTDGYEAYHKLPPEITIIGCWVHMRRKFTDAIKTIPAEQKARSEAQKALHKIGYLFHLEDLWKHLSPQERYERRLKESQPLAEEYFRWLETLMILPQSATGKAIRYALKQKPWLMNVYLDGRSEISNNRIENNVRPVSLGRKNWLFCATVKGAQATAIVYSLIETAKANGLKPFEYLELLFESLPNAKSNILESLLPWSTTLPEHCRMPKPAEDTEYAKKKRNEIHDGVRPGILKRGA